MERGDLLRCGKRVEMWLLIVGVGGFGEGGEFDGG